MNLVPFDSQANLPAYLADPTAGANINKDVAIGPAFPSMSIKGKVFTLVKDGQRKILTKPDEPDEIAQSIGIVMLRANMNAKTYYSKGFVEGDSEGARPDCYSHDGIAPSAGSSLPQSKKCAICPHNQWGSKVRTDTPGAESKGKACADSVRAAIAAPDKLTESMLLRIPPGSRKNLREAIKVVDARKIPYNAVVMKITFDPEQASPTLKFKPIGLLNDADYAVAKEQYDGELVRAITGLDDHGQEEAAAAPPPVSSDELDAALAARAATDAAAAPPPAPTAAPTPAPTPKPTKPKPTAAPTPAPTAAPVAAAPEAAAPAADTGAGNLLSDLDALLGSTDD